MSRLGELIAELCPDGVEYRALEEVAELVRGSGLQKKDFSETGVGCIHYGQIHTKFGAYTDVVLSYVPEELAKKLTVVHPGDVVVAATSEDVSACCKAVAWMGDVDVVTGGHCVVVRHDLDPKYLSYCFQTDSFYAQKKRFAAGVKVIEMRTDKLARIRIPVPPIEVQREVVRILDEYTAAHDELVRQLEEHAFCIEQAHAAYLQAAYDEAFRHCERVPLGKHCNLINGDRGKNYPSRGNFVDEGAAFINAGHIQNGVLDFTDMNYITEENYSALRSGKVKSGDILYCLRGSLGKHCLISNVHGAIASSLVIIRCDREYYLPEFINYTLDMPFITDQMNSVSNGSAQPNLAGRSVAGYQVPLPTLKEQRAFISQLDRHAVGSFNELAAELRLQSRLYNQQLALVRNQLLSFPEKVA